MRRLVKRTALALLTSGLLLASGTAQAEDAIVRARDGDWGMFFRFGGLATLVASNTTRDVNTLLVTQVGLKAVLSEELMIPFFFGTGLRSVDRPNSDANTDFGLDAGAGIEWHFRIWRRISPFLGANIGFGLSNPTGADNATWGVSLGPTLGVEYYVADRVSLTAQYLLSFEIDRGSAPSGTRTTVVELQTLAGGALNLTFYF